MPTITVIYEDLLNQIDKKLSIEALQDIFFLTKCQVESIDNNEITLEIMADRPDLLSTEGIARELRGILGLETGLKEYKIKRSDVTIIVEPTVEIVRPYISSSVIRDIKLDDEGVRQVMQLQEKLHLTYCRKRRKVSIGIHDLDTIEHDVYYAGIPPEKIRFIPLDEKREMNGKEILELIPKGREFGHIIKDFPRYPLLYDRNGNVLSMPPIINGVVTRVTEGTKNLLLDITGTDPDLVEFVNNIMTTNIFERGGTIEKVKIIQKGKERYAPKLKSRSIRVRTNFANKTLGLNLTNTQIEKSLKKMRYGIKKTNNNFLEVYVPPYRADILHEIDVIEDVALGFGYNKLKPEMPSVSTMGIERDIIVFIRKACDIMIGLGFQEILNYIMTNKKNLFDKMEIHDYNAVEVENPLTNEYSILRNSLLPGLINFLSYNKHVSYPQNIFECGDIIIFDEVKPTRTSNKKRIAAAICDYRVSYEDIQSILYSFLKNLGVKDWNLKSTKNPSFINGRVASLRINNTHKELGIIGEIDPKILNNFEIENPTVAFEIELEDIMSLLG